MEGSSADFSTGAEEEPVSLGWVEWLGWAPWGTLMQQM